MAQTHERLIYSVPGVSCERCRTAITDEVQRVTGVVGIHVDLEARRVTVTGSNLDDDVVRAAIDEAGYDVAGPGRGS